jgi:glyoxylase-like metal-dependent hydrolase (beta-lactamase superfamily II)
MTATEYYTGDTTVGGPAAVRELPGLRITKLAVGPMNNNAYFLTCTATGDTALIDAAAEPDRLLAERGDGLLVTVITTHQHHDHWQGLEQVTGVTGPEAIVAHPLDAPGLPIPVTKLVDDGDVITVGELPLKIIHLRGHTPGSIAILYDADPAAPHLFTGDSLFPGGPGNTRGDAANFASLMDDLESRIFDRLPDATWVYPGHGGDTTLGAERPHLAEWRARGW